MDHYQRKRCGRWCEQTDRRLRHGLVVYIRSDSSRVQNPSLSLSDPRMVLLGLSSFLPSFPCYITPISPPPLPPVSVYPVISLSRYSLDRYASRLSLFCLSNTHSTAMWVRIGRLLCSCSRSRNAAATIRYLATAFTLNRDYSPPIILSLLRYFRCVAFIVFSELIISENQFFLLSQMFSL